MISLKTCFYSVRVTFTCRHRFENKPILSNKAYYFNLYIIFKPFLLIALFASLQIPSDMIPTLSLSFFNGIASQQQIWFYYLSANCIITLNVIYFSFWMDKVMQTEVSFNSFSIKNAYVLILKVSKICVFLTILQNQTRNLAQFFQLFNVLLYNSYHILSMISERWSEAFCDAHFFLQQNSCRIFPDAGIFEPTCIY